VLKHLPELHDGPLRGPDGCAVGQQGAGHRGVSDPLFIATRLRSLPLRSGRASLRLQVAHQLHGQGPVCAASDVVHVPWALARVQRPDNDTCTVTDINGGLVIARIGVVTTGKLFSGVPTSSKPRRLLDTTVGGW
jgi:hypothetical protein